MTNIQIGILQNHAGAAVEPEQVKQQVSAYLSEHPELTTTVQDGGVTPQKTSFISYETDSWTETVPDFTNQLPISTDTDGSVYNGCGYQAGYRYNSSGTLTAASNITLTGLIPIAEGDILRTGSGVYVGDGSLEQISFWKSDKTFIKYVSRANLVSSYGATVTDGAMTITIDSTVTSAAAALADTAYVRLAARTIDADTVVTVNQPITYSTVEHTGEASNFQLSPEITVPACTVLDSRVAVLEAGSDVVPAYVTEEAKAAAEKVLALQNEHTFTFAAVSDAHYPYNTATAAAIRHAGQAVSKIRDYCRLDFAVMLGDYIVGGKSSTKADSREAFHAVNTALREGFSGLPNIRCNGNHDVLPYNYDGTFTAAELLGYIGNYSDGTGERLRNYGVLDFAAHKLRVIYLNTCDVSDIAVKSNDGGNFSGHRISPAQLLWLAETALDMTGKTGWNVLVLGHTPLNWPVISYTDANGLTWSQNVQHALTLLDAYVSGGSGSLTMESSTISYDFSGKNAGTLIGYIHGHTHNFNSGVMGDTDILRIAVPNACPGRNNEYASSASETYTQFGDAITYSKTADTAQDTALNIITIDTAARKISCTNYGAGIDREYLY
ncbi:metallophosphoesterase family protein [Butyricicoccus sp.]|uniref:metallophosphoesterase family protein n=1 Tax=Butyricicoccus sp. TaxID=2049021 RepID=UPI003F190A82